MDLLCGAISARSIFQISVTCVDGLVMLCGSLRTCMWQAVFSLENFHTILGFGSSRKIILGVIGLFKVVDEVFVKNNVLKV
ncbi:hypothetical protein L484_003444 [Morus notabilis]|uniref:Uncharacterized protein n=1 Tax=Morus notabilis TaxID=981085 RepID=W9QU90_9ROSA|nr:hypothetical protein L484_003444 [Morus notabilis]